MSTTEGLLSRWQLRQFIENGSARIVMPDLIWTGGISETHKVAILASAHQVPIAPHDCTGPVNIFACAQVCMGSPNAMIQEHQPGYYKDWYGRFVDPNLDIRDGFLHAPQRPGIGTRLRPEVRDRSDATVTVSDKPGETFFSDNWDRFPVRTAEMEAEVEQLRKERRGG